MTIRTPAIREFAFDRRAHVRATSPRTWRVDRAPRHGGRRVLGFDRTLVGQVFSGPGVISGILELDAVPARRRVCIHLESDGVRMRDGYSSAIDGTFSFDLLPADRPYTVIAYDDSGTYAALIWNGVLPTV